MGEYSGETIPGLFEIEYDSYHFNEVELWLVKIKRTAESVKQDQDNNSDIEPEIST